MPAPRDADGLSPPGILFSFVIAMACRILPLPDQWLAANPDWLALLLIYWTHRAPTRVGVVTAWLLGLCADALTARFLGQHALAYTLVAYLNLRVGPVMLPLPWPLQCLWVLTLLLLTLWLILWTQRVELAEPARLVYWLPAFTGALVWPCLAWAMGPRRRRNAREP